jgi:hypothetical protein
MCTLMSFTWSAVSNQKDNLVNHLKFGLIVSYIHTCLVSGYLLASLRHQCFARLTTLVLPCLDSNVIYFSLCVNFC